MRDRRCLPRRDSTGGSLSTPVCCNFCMPGSIITLVTCLLPDLAHLLHLRYHITPHRIAVTSAYPSTSALFCPTVAGFALSQITGAASTYGWSTSALPSARHAALGAIIQGRMPSMCRRKCPH